MTKASEKSEKRRRSVRLHRLSDFSLGSRLTEPSLQSNAEKVCSVLDVDSLLRSLDEVRLLAVSSNGTQTRKHFLKNSKRQSKLPTSLLSVHLGRRVTHSIVGVDPRSKDGIQSFDLRKTGKKK